MWLKNRTIYIHGASTYVVLNVRNSRQRKKRWHYSIGSSKHSRSQMIRINDINVVYVPGKTVTLLSPVSQLTLHTAAEVLALSGALRQCGKQMEETEMAAHIRQYARRTSP